MPVLLAPALCTMGSGPQVLSSETGSSPDVRMSDSSLQVGIAMAAENLGAGFLVPPLIRFVNGEDAYLSMTSGGPHAFFNIEDHLSKSTGVDNAKFQVRGQTFKAVDRALSED